MFFFLDYFLQIIWSQIRVDSLEYQMTPQKFDQWFFFICITMSELFIWLEIVESSFFQMKFYLGKNELILFLTSN